MRFRLKAVDASSQVVALDLDAASEANARDAAQRQGYAVLTIEAARFAITTPQRFPATLFSLELLALLEAGLNLVEALQALAERAPQGETRQVLERLLESLNEGLPFSRALEALPAQFSPLYVATVKASERTGDLKDALTRYIAYQEELERVRRKVFSASIYPAILLAVGTAVFLFLMLYVVPRFAHVYDDIRTELPFFSAVLLNIGTAIERHLPAILALLVTAIFACAFALSSGPLRARINEHLWRIPSVGERMKLYQLARLYRTLAMLLKAGIPVVQTLDMVQGLLAAHLREALARAKRALEEGRPISTAFAAAGLGTPIAARMLAVGERTGNMGEAMERIARFCDDETSRSIDTFTRTFEPLLMAALGLAVGMVVVLMYMPVFELAGSLQ